MRAREGLLHFGGVCYCPSHEVGEEEAHSCENETHSLFMHSCLLVIVLFSMETTVNLLLPHPVL